MIRRGCANLLFILGVVVAAFCGCASDKDLVANAAASYKYYETHYEMECVETKGPASCHDDQASLSSAKQEVQLTNEVQKIGALPKKARSNLKAIAKDPRKYGRR